MRKYILLILIVFTSLPVFAKPVINYSESYSVTSVQATNDYGIFGSFDGRIRLVDVRTSEIMLLEGGHKKQIVSMAVSKNGRYLLSASQDDIIILWDLAEKKEVKRILKQGMGVRGVAFGADDSKIYIAFPLTVYEYDINGWENTAIYEGYKNGNYSIAVSYDGKYFATGSKNGDIYITDISKQEIVSTLKAGMEHIISVDFAGEKNMLISGSYDKTVRVYDISKNKLVKEFSIFNDAVRSVRFDNMGTRAVIASDDGQVVVYNIQTGVYENKSYGSGGEVTCMSAPRDIKYVVYGRGLPYEEERYGVLAYMKKNGAYRKLYSFKTSDIIISEDNYISARGSFGEYISSYLGGNKENMTDIINKYMKKDKLLMK